MRVAVGIVLAAGWLNAQTAPAKPKPRPAAAKVKRPGVPAREPGLYATIGTSLGPIVVKLYEKESPVTVKNFVDLATGAKEWTDPKSGEKVRKPFYDGLTFHRVIPNFMIQGGDPLGTGTGGTDPIQDEFDSSLTFDQPGRLAMANRGPNTGSSQFFITEVPTPHLNGRHTIFGQVVEGQELVARIARVPIDDENNRPKTPVRITQVTIKRVPVGKTPAAKKPVAPKPAGTKPAAPKPRPAKAKPAAG